VSSGVRRVVVLGSTGSIGTQALDVIRQNPDRFQVVALAAGGRDVRLLALQAAEFHVDVVSVASESVVDQLRRELAALAVAPRIVAGRHAATELAREPADVVLNGITGSIGLGPTLAALATGTTLALANKESLIAGGPLVKAAAGPGQLVPVDSEHSANAQCLRGGRAEEIRRLVLTASGGPFRGRQRDGMHAVTPQQALAHPTWDMGLVVTTNSATLINKGLELIEAHLLFDVPYDQIDVVVHPQSQVHSMVEFIDGSTLAQVSHPDMRLPIALGLAWPDRVAGATTPYDWAQATSWTFEPMDDDAFPAVALCRKTGLAGGVAPAILNAANEEAVTAFHAGALPFLGIVDTVSAVVHEHLAAGVRNPVDVSDVHEAEEWARTRARELVGVAA
jgi:1-deoxy-D-xylulose-5-phosphate reductoisomerase